MSLFASGPRFSHCDCHALCLPAPTDGLRPWPLVLAISLILSSGFLSLPGESEDAIVLGGEGVGVKELLADEVAALDILAIAS